MTRSEHRICDRLAGRRIRVGVSDNAVIVADVTFEPGSSITIGGDAADAVRVSGWIGPTLTLITEGALLHLAPGMHVHMCHDDGEDRVKSTFDELALRGMEAPLPITVSKLNITIREGLSVYVKYLRDGETR